jgi:hypothetical protein
MSFLATTPPPTSTSEPVIENDPWFPEIDLGALRAACRLDGTVTVARLREAATAAMLSVNRELATFKARQLAASIEALADIPADQVGRSSVLVLHYRRAVYSGVQAELVEEYRDIDTTGKGDKNADAMEPRADTHRRNMRWALSDLLGQPRTTVELI